MPFAARNDLSSASDGSPVTVSPICFWNATIARRVIGPIAPSAGPPIFQVNGLYVYDTKKFLKSCQIIPKKTLPFEISPWTAIKIDTDFEFKVVESMIMGIDSLSTLIHEL